MGNFASKDGLPTKQKRKSTPNSIWYFDGCLLYAFPLTNLAMGLVYLESGWCNCQLLTGRTNQPNIAQNWELGLLKANLEFTLISNDLV